ncbi:MAG: RimK/LysX family protein [Candidatus Aenigmatarchaeota archaeon]
MKHILGIVEKVVIKGTKEKHVLALVDTGAKLTSVDAKLADEAGIGPVVRSTRIKSASKDDVTKRPVHEVAIEIGGRKFIAEVNVADRSRMAFPVLIGRNILCGNFLVDAEKNIEVFRRVAAQKKMLSEFR